MELEDFPVDIQALTIQVSCNTAIEGIVPATFCNLEQAACSINLSTFALSNLWQLHPKVLVERVRWSRCVCDGWIHSA